jgi:hypothetical protein
MATTYLNKTLSGSPTNNLKWTWSAWVKKTKNGIIQPLFYADDGSSANFTKIQFHDTDSVLAQNYVGSSTYGYKITTGVYRDNSAWYHLVMRYDSANSDDTQRFVIWVNGVDSNTLAMDSNTFPDQNRASIINAGNEHRIGRGNNNVGSNYFEGIMSHVHFCDGYAYSASDFGSTDATTGEWKINTSPSVSYGTNGFFILKDGNSVTDQSGNSNNFTANGTITNTEDCPSNNFCTLTNNYNQTNSQGVVLNNGSNVAYYASNSNRMAMGSMGMTSGKYYFEAKPYSTGSFTSIGIIDTTWGDINGASGYGLHDGTGASGFSFASDGSGKYNSNTQTSWGGSYIANDIVGVAVDCDNSKIYFAINGTWQESGDPTSGSTGTGSAFNLVSGRTYLPAVGLRNGSQVGFNFGNGLFTGSDVISSEGTNASGIGKFEYDVPTGYTALSTKGLNL